MVCDASRDGIGCALEQETAGGWATIAYASRFLNSCEKKNSVNELELLAAVWAIELFKYYLYGRRFTLIADHQALISALQCNKNHKIYQKRLTRWIDLLLLVDFDIKHLAGSKMGLIDYISRHPVGISQPPAYWDEHFVVALIVDFITCLEFQDSTSFNLKMNSYPNGYLGAQSLNRNEKGLASNSFATQTKLTVKSPLPNFRRIQRTSNSQNSLNCTQIENQIELQKILPNTNRQLTNTASGMSLPPFKRIMSKCHNGAQTVISFHPKNISSFDTFSDLSQHGHLTFSDTSHQAIPSEDSLTFRRVKNDKVDQKSQTIEEANTPPVCLATAFMDEEDVPMYRNVFDRNVFDRNFIAAATKKDRLLQPLLKMVRGQKWDNLKSCYGAYFYNVRNRLSVRDGILLYDDRAVIPKQIRQILVDLLHLTHPGEGGMLEAAKNVSYPYLNRDIIATAQNCKECRQKCKNLKFISSKQLFTALDAVVEPNKEIQMDFAGPLPDENNKEVYILVGVDRVSRFQSAKVVTITKADTIIRFMQTHIVNNGLPRNVRCDQA